MLWWTLLHYTMLHSVTLNWQLITTYFYGMYILNQSMSINVASYLYCPPPPWQSLASLRTGMYNLPLFYRCSLKPVNKPNNTYLLILKSSVVNGRVASFHLGFNLICHKALLYGGITIREVMLLSRPWNILHAKCLLRTINTIGKNHPNLLQCPKVTTIHVFCNKVLSIFFYSKTFVTCLCKK